MVNLVNMVKFVTLKYPNFDILKFRLETKDISTRLRGVI